MRDPIGVLKKPKTYSNDLRHLQEPLARRMVPLKNWVNWKWVQKDGNWTKPPYMPKSPGDFAKNNDPSTWGTYEQACANVEAGKADGIGFCLLGTNISAFDIDNCRNPETKEIDPIAMALVKRANSYSEATPSGTGLRIIGTASDRYLHRKLKILNSNVSVEFYRNCGRYITISNMPLPGVTTELADIDALLDKVFDEIETGEAKPKVEPEVETNTHPHKDDISDKDFDIWLVGSLAPDQVALITKAIWQGKKVLRGPKGDWSEQFHHAVCWLKDKDWSEAHILRLFRKYPTGIADKYLNDKNGSDARLAKEVKRCYGKAKDKVRHDGDGAAPPDQDEINRRIIIEMNERHAAGSFKGKFRVMTLLPDRDFPKQHFAEFSTKTDFCNINEHPKVSYFDAVKEKMVRQGRGAYFLSSPAHMHFDGIDFEPGGPQIIKRTDRHGRVTVYPNMFSGFSVEPAEGNCSLYLAHVHDNICGGDEMLFDYNMNWMASGVQRPGNPGRTAVSMRGDPGVGKGIFVTEYGKIFGRHFLHLTNSDQLIGKFNALSAQALLIFADEAMFAGDRRAAQILKTLISEPTKILEFKGVDSFQIPNYGRVAFATNDEHPIRIEEKDRRYCSIYVQPDHAKDKPYFIAILDQMRDGGRAALLDFLLKRDISNFNPETIPNSDELLKQKIASAHAGDRIIIGFAQDGYLPGAMVDMGGQKRERPWIARGRGPGFLFDEMRRRGGRDMLYMDEIALTDILKQWGFKRHPLGDQTGWAAPLLDVLRKAITKKYPGVQWDNDILNWGSIAPAEREERGPYNQFTDPDSPPITLTMHLHHGTAAGVLMSISPDAEPVWMRKASIKMKRNQNGTYEVTIPGWLAKANGLTAPF